MVSPVVLAVLSMLATGFADFIYKRARVKGAAPALFLLYQSISFNATNVAFVVYSGSVNINLVTIIFGASCASLVYLSIYIFLKSLGPGQASTNVPIFRLSFIITAVLALLFLHESATFGRLLAVGLAALSILTLSISLRSSPTSFAAVLQLAFATSAYGLFGVLYKIAIIMGSSPVGILVVQGMFFITYAFLAAKREGPIVKSRRILVHAPICGILFSSSYLLLLESLKHGDVSVSFSIVQLSFIVTSLLAMLVWREEIQARSVLGIILAMLAVLSFAYL